MKIGFIGLGLMGSAMCANLIEKSGMPVMVYDVMSSACEQMQALGAERAESNAALAAQCGIIFSMVPKDEHVRAVYDEILPHVHRGTLLIEMSTIAPAVSRELAAKATEAGCDMVDAPVVKSRPAAVAGTLGIYVGGSEEAYQRAEPLLANLGSHVIHLGSNGAGLVMKLCHNALVAQIQNGVNEAMMLAAVAAGIETHAFAQAISYGGGQNFYLDSKAEAIASADFSTAFSVSNMDKDVHLALALGQEFGLPLDGVALTCLRYEEAMKRGYGGEDFCATCKLFR